MARGKSIKLAGPEKTKDRASVSRSPARSARELRISILLEEYRTLRAESLQGIQARHQVITFAFGAISVVIAGILTSEGSMLMLGFIAYFAVPQIGKSSLLMWLGEYCRSARAGARLRCIEQEINEAAEAPLLCWENRLSSGRVHMTYPYTATIVVVQAVAYISIIIGISYLTSFAMAHRNLNLQSVVNIPEITLRPSTTLFLVFGGLSLTAMLIELVFWRYFKSIWTDARLSNYSFG